LHSLQSSLAPIEAWGSFRKGARQAAVAAVLYQRAGEWHIPFIARRPDLPDHPGQVALPGGRVHPGEEAWPAAAREAQEEVGVPARRLQPLGAGQPLSAAVTNYSVVPFVAWLPSPDFVFVPDPGEVSGVLEVPLARLLAAEAWADSLLPWMGRHFPWQDTRIWGLTARILADLLPHFGSALGAAAATAQGLDSTPS